MVFKLLAPQRGVDGHRDGASHEHGKEQDKVGPVGGQHEGYPLACLEAARLECRACAGGRCAQFAVAKDRAVGVVVVELDVCPFRRAVCMPVKDIEQGVGLLWQLQRAGAVVDRRHAQAERRSIVRLDHQPQKFARCGSVENCALVESHPEGALDARAQLNARQAVQGQVTLQRAVQFSSTSVRTSGVQVTGDLIDAGQQRLRQLLELGALQAFWRRLVHGSVASTQCQAWLPVCAGNRACLTAHSSHSPPVMATLRRQR